MIRVFIADDHEVVRQGMRHLFDTTSDIRVVGEAVDGRAALQAAENADFDVMVLDLSLPKVSGIEVLRRIHKDHPTLPVVVLSMYPEEAFAPRMLNEGAAAYISKERPLADVEAAIRRALIATPHAPRDTGEHARATATQPHEALSAREYQVFLLIVQGRSNVEIAAELDLVASTVSNHLAKVKHKLSARTVADIVAYALRLGLI